jgi:hypothetical protein
LCGRFVCLAISVIQIQSCSISQKYVCLGSRKSHTNLNVFLKTALTYDGLISTFSCAHVTNVCSMLRSGIHSLKPGISFHTLYSIFTMFTFRLVKLTI